jgi:hypothetical protein
MALTVQATYEDGVFVPAQKPPLANHDRVRLIVEPIGGAQGPEAGTVLFRKAKRIRLDPELARQIASAPEFHPDGC